MSGDIINRRTALTAALITAAGLRGFAGATEESDRSALGHKNLQTVLAFWKLWEADPPSKEALAAMCTDDCIVRVGREDEVVAEGKEAVTALFGHIGQSRFKVDITRTFVTGRIVVTEFKFSSWKTGEAPKPAPGLFGGVFLLKQGKIWMWIDAEV